MFKKYLHLRIAIDKDNKDKNEPVIMSQIGIKGSIGHLFTLRLPIITIHNDNRANDDNENIHKT